MSNVLIAGGPGREAGKESGPEAGGNLRETVQRRGSKGRDSEDDSGCSGNVCHSNFPIRGGQQAIKRLHRRRIPYVGIHMAQAEKEMLILYNPVAKATPPKADDHDPNYSQPEEIAQIWEALEGESIKWLVIL